MEKRGKFAAQKITAHNAVHKRVLKRDLKGSDGKNLGHQKWSVILSAARLKRSEDCAESKNPWHVSATSGNTSYSHLIV